MAPQERNSITRQDSGDCSSSTKDAVPQIDTASENINKKDIKDKIAKETTNYNDQNTSNQDDKFSQKRAFENKGYVSSPSDKTDTTDENKRTDDNNERRRSERFTTDVYFDDVLTYLGEFGLYQRMLFLLMIPFAFFVSWVYFSQIFMTLTPEDFWCRIPALQNYSQSVRISSLPKEGGKHSRCRQYDVKWDEVLKGSSLPIPDEKWPTKGCTDGWEYSSDIPYATITTELNWVCDKDGLPATAQAVFFCGAIVGGLFFGWLADRYGRIPALVGTNVVGFLGGIGTAWCNNFLTFCLCRFIVGLAFDNCFTMMYILVLEYTGPKWRTFVANMSIAIFFTLATCILPWIAYFLADWRWFTVTISVPLLLSLATPWMVPESARWLVSQGRVDESVVILKRIEKINNMKIPDKILGDFKETCIRIQKEEEISGKIYSVLELFKTPRLRRIVILLILIWMAISLVFDGHVRNVGALGLDVFLTFTIAGATEFPADTLLTLILDKWGRRWLACGSMMLSGLFSIFATLVPLGPPSASLAIMGRFAVNFAYNIGLQYAAELLPTVVRAQGVALIHIMGYVGSLLSPFIVYLVNIHQSLPLTILGIIGILCGILCLFLPETVNKDLPTTLQDGEDFGRDQKFWEAPCCGSKEIEQDEYPGVYQERRTSISSIKSMEATSFSRSGFVGLPGSRASVRASFRKSKKRVSMSLN